MFLENGSSISLGTLFVGPGFRSLLVASCLGQSLVFIFVILVYGL